MKVKILHNHVNFFCFSEWMCMVTVWRYDRRYQCDGWYQAWCKWRDLQFTNYLEIGLQILSINQLDILYTYIHIDRMRCNIGADASIYLVLLQLLTAAPSFLNISCMGLALFLLLQMRSDDLQDVHWVTYH